MVLSPHINQTRNSTRSDSNSKKCKAPVTQCRNDEMKTNFRVKCCCWYPKTIAFTDLMSTGSVGNIGTNPVTDKMDLSLLFVGTDVGTVVCYVVLVSSSLPHIVETTQLVELPIGADIDGNTHSVQCVTVCSHTKSNENNVCGSVFIGTGNGCVLRYDFKLTYTYHSSISSQPVTADCLQLDTSFLWEQQLFESSQVVGKIATCSSVVNAEKTGDFFVATAGSAISICDCYLPMGGNSTNGISNQSQHIHGSAISGVVVVPSHLGISQGLNVTVYPSSTTEVTDYYVYSCGFDGNVNEYKVKCLSVPNSTSSPVSSSGAINNTCYSLEFMETVYSNRHNMQMLGLALDPLKLMLSCVSVIPGEL